MAQKIGKAVVGSVKGYMKGGGKASAGHAVSTRKGGGNKGSFGKQGNSRLTKSVNTGGNYGPLGE